MEDTLRQLQMYDFAIQEAALYLNSHPNDTNAINYYHMMRQCAQQARAAYEQEAGPLTNREETSGCWTYIQGKWPWEGDQ